MIGQRAPLAHWRPKATSSERSPDPLGRRPLLGGAGRRESDARRRARLTSGRAWARDCTPWPAGRRGTKTNTGGPAAKMLAGQLGRRPLRPHYIADRTAAAAAAASLTTRRVVWLRPAPGGRWSCARGVTQVRGGQSSPLLLLVSLGCRRRRCRQLDPGSGFLRVTRREPPATWLPRTAAPDISGQSAVGLGERKSDEPLGQSRSRRTSAGTCPRG